MTADFPRKAQPMAQRLISLLLAALAFAACDAVWLSLAYQPLYHAELGLVIAAKPDPLAALLFYSVYIFGLCYFAIWPSLQNFSLRTAASQGAVFGLVAYGTYDLTNQATLAFWSWKVTGVDMIWGAVASATASTVTLFLMRMRFAAKGHSE